MFLDPHVILGVLLLLAGLTTFGVSIIILLINAIKVRPLGKVLTVLVASFLILVLATTAIATSQGDTLSPITDEQPGDDVAQGPEITDPGTVTPGQSDNGNGQTDTGTDQDSDNQQDSGDADETTPPVIVNPSGSVKVHFIDSGQGDAILIQAPDKTVLIDGSTRSAGNIVVNYLKAQGVQTIDLVIATHPHEDHIGGLIAVFNSFTVKEIIDSGIEHTTKTYEDYLNLIDAKDIPLLDAKPGMTRDLGGTVKLEILHPAKPSTSHLNDASVVARITFGTTSFLFTGDAEQASETTLLNSGQTLASTVLKVGHHGSRTSTSQSFINKVNPQYAVISAGNGNSYGHPHKETLDKLKAKNVNTYRTDLNGNIVFDSDGKIIKISSDKKATDT